MVVSSTLGILTPIEERDIEAQVAREIAIMEVLTLKSKK
jgi:hypothetical protein